MKLDTLKSEIWGVWSESVRFGPNASVSHQKSEELRGLLFSVLSMYSIPLEQYQWLIHNDQITSTVAKYNGQLAK